MAGKSACRGRIWMVGVMESATGGSIWPTRRLAIAHRQQAEEAMAAYQQPSGRQPPGMLGWLRRGGDQPAQLPGGLAVATQQANRAHDRERELRQDQQRRDGWLEANAHLGRQYR